MIIHDNFQFHPPVVSEKKIFNNFSQSEAIMSPGSHGGGHNLTWRPYGNYVKQTSSQEPLYGLEPYLAEMFLARSLSSVVTFCSDRKFALFGSAVSEEKI
jgi:hypothetical protein